MAGGLTGLLAAAATTTPTVESILLSLGLPGVVILALGIYARGSIKASEERARRLEDDNRRIYQIMTDQMIPALTRATDTTMEATSVIAEMNRHEEKRAAIEEARRIAALEQRDRP